MIEPKLKAKIANSGQLFRPGWVSSAECMLHRIEQPATRTAASISYITDCKITIFFFLKNCSLLLFNLLAVGLFVSFCFERSLSVSFCSKDEGGGGGGGVCAAGLSEPLPYISLFRWPIKDPI